MIETNPSRPFFRSLGGSAALVVATGAVSLGHPEGQETMYTYTQTQMQGGEEERADGERHTKTHSLGTEANFVPAGSLSCGSRERKQVFFTPFSSSCSSPALPQT